MTIDLIAKDLYTLSGSSQTICNCGVLLSSEVFLSGKILRFSLCVKQRQFTHQHASFHIELIPSCR